MKPLRWFALIVAASILLSFSFMYGGRDQAFDTDAASPRSGTDTAPSSSAATAAAVPVDASPDSGVAASLNSATPLLSLSTAAPKISLAAMDVLRRHPVGLWPLDCTCRKECLDSGDRDAAVLGHIENGWGDVALELLLNNSFAPWTLKQTTAPATEKRARSSDLDDDESTTTAGAATTAASAVKSNKMRPTTAPKRWTGRLSMDDVINMVSCRYRSKGGMNPTGVWAHISGNNVTILRHLIDGYSRSSKIIKYLKDLVARAPEPFPIPLSVYISTTDLSCNNDLPFLTFFGNAISTNIVIPDDTFKGTHVAKGWAEQRDDFLFNRSNRFPPFRQRKPVLFFRGSPSHPLREFVRVESDECCAARSAVKLAVMEKFKSLQLPLREFPQFRYHAAIRGRSASSRDKYLNLLNSTVLWAQEDPPPPPAPKDARRVKGTATATTTTAAAANASDVSGEGAAEAAAAAAENGDVDGDVDAAAATKGAAVPKKAAIITYTQAEHTPYQFYHQLWKGHVNYVPLRPREIKCTLDLLDGNVDAAERIAQRSLEVGRFLSQERVDAYFIRVLRRYAELQNYAVAPDPIDHIEQVHSLAKRRYRDVNTLYASWRWHIKWNLARWLRLRSRQLRSCRENGNTLTFNARWNASGCWPL